MKILESIVLSLFLCPLVRAFSSTHFDETLLEQLQNPREAEKETPLSKPKLQDGVPADLTCRVLVKLLPDATIPPWLESYQSVVEGSWSAICRQSPACAVLPITEEELSLTLKTLSLLKTKFAVRSGGHTNNLGFSSIGRDGVLISLQRFKSLSISNDHQVLTVGSGARWGEVYEYVSEYPVSVVGGRIPAVGVAGFLLGGGLSLFYNHYGLAADQVLRYRVALPSGEFVDATPHTNVDLYKGLKGGMSNYGIVTEFDLQTSEYSDIYFEVHLYKPEDTPSLLEAYAEYLLDPEMDSKSSVQIEITANHALGFFGYIHHTDKPAAFERFRSIPTMVSPIKPSNGTVKGLLVDMMGSHVVDPGSRYSASFAFKLNDADFLLKTYEIFKQVAARLPRGISLTYAPQGMTANVAKVGEVTHGGNLFGIIPETQVWQDLFVEFSDVSLASQAIKAIEDIIAVLDEAATSAGVGMDFRFPNNASPKQNPLSYLHRADLDTIRKTARKYDPDRVMQVLQNDGFLLEDLESDQEEEHNDREDSFDGGRDEL